MINMLIDKINSKLNNIFRMDNIIATETYINLAYPLFLFDIMNMDNDFNIIGYTEINKKLKKNTYGKTRCEFYLYLLEKGDVLYASISITHSLLWYKINDMENYIDLINIINGYNPELLPYDFTNKINALLGSDDNIDGQLMLDFQNNMIVNKYTELLLWGTLWKDHPFRNDYDDEIRKEEHIIYYAQAMRNNDNQNGFNVRTLFTKSILTFENIDNIIGVTIKYNPIENNNIEILNNLLNKLYPKDLPIDVLCSLINYPYIELNENN